MTYVALYRQWRPQRFADVVGQEHVVRTLRNALASDRLAHAYLFCGPRGTGKTTAAKLLAKAVNCLAPVDGEPCNACAQCEDITAGRSVDVLEIDAASNRGIDEIRDLREKVRYAPAAARRKVYIIDEVHMLTNEAFNALLKTLEEPPAHVLFILATTDPQKLPLTVLSRCQRFDFHRFAESQIIGRLELVAADRGVRVEPAGLSAIARAAEGGMRDALSLLDQALAFGGTEVTQADVLQVLGAAPLEALLALARRLASHDAVGTLAAVAAAVESGHDLRQFVRDLLACLRALLLIRLGAAGSQSGYTREEEQALAAVAAAFAPEELTALLQSLAAAESEMRWSSQPRIFLELALLRGVEPAADQQPAADEPRAAAQPKEAAASAKPPAPPAPPSQARASVSPAVSEPSAGTPAAAPAGAPPGLEAVRRRWPEVLEQVGQASRATEALLREGQPTAADGWQVTVSFPARFRFHRDRISRQRERETVEGVLSRLFGGPCGLQVRAGDDEPASNGGSAGREQILSDPMVRRVVEALNGEITDIRMSGNGKGDGQ